MHHAGVGGQASGDAQDRLAVPLGNPRHPDRGLAMDGLAVDATLAGNHQVGVGNDAVQPHGRGHDLEAPAQLAPRKAYIAAPRPPAAPEPGSSATETPRSRLICLASAPGWRRAGAPFPAWRPSAGRRPPRRLSVRPAGCRRRRRPRSGILQPGVEAGDVDPAEVSRSPPPKPRSSPSRSSRRTPSAWAMPAPPSLVALPPMPRMKCRAPGPRRRGSARPHRRSWFAAGCAGRGRAA